MVVAPSGATGTTTGTATTGAVQNPEFTPYSAVGEVQLNSDNSFTLKEWIYSGGKVQAVTTSGTYKVGPDCRLALTFANNTSGTAGGTTGGVQFQAPSMFTVALSRGDGVTGTRSFGSPSNFGASGSLIVTPANVSTVIGTFLPQ